VIYGNEENMQNNQPCRLQCHWSTPPAPHEQILSIISGYWHANALGLATKLGLADLLAEGPVQVEELASRTGANTQALFRLLRALESIGIFAQTDYRTFCNTPASELLRKDHSDSQAAGVLHQLCRGNGCYEAWNEFEHTIMTGDSSINKIYGCGFFEFLAKEPQASDAMSGAMRSISSAITPAVTAAYDWGRFQEIADVGGGIGTQIVSILNAFPQAQGVLLDLPHVVADAIPHERLKILEGSFFDSAPPRADAYLLRFVLHDWSDESAAAILRTVRRSMKPSATLILAEWLIPEGPEQALSKWTDLHMMVLFQEARERTEMELSKLLAAEGFELEEVVPTDSSVSLLVAKAAKEWDTRSCFLTEVPSQAGTQQAPF
jgi:DNA-binding HxlR family transcriptional regulator